MERLLAKIRSHLSYEDTLVFLGDYIDRGPDSRGCIDLLVQLQQENRCAVVALMGNHEQWMLRTKNDFTRHSWLLGMQAFATIANYSPLAAEQLDAELRLNGEQLLTQATPLSYELFFDAMPPSHHEFFASLRPFYRAPEVICTHGGLEPSGGSVEAQKTHSLIWGARDFPQAYRGEEIIAYGHWDNAVLDEVGHPWPRIENNTFGVDTISHGVLTAMRFPDLAIFQSS